MKEIKLISRYTFTSCGKHTSRKNFLNFFLAFDIITWILILVANLSLGFFLRLIIGWGHYDKPVSHPPQTNRVRRQGECFEYLPLTFAGFELQLEQGTDSLSNPTLRKYWKTILLTFPHFLATIVLTNAFKGDNVINLIAPPADKPFTNFRDVYTNGFVFYSILTEYNYRGVQYGPEFYFIKDGLLWPTQTYVSEISPDQYDEIRSSIDYSLDNIRSYDTLEEIMQNNQGKGCPKIAILGWTDLYLLQEKLNNLYRLKAGKNKNSVTRSR